MNKRIFEKLLQLDRRSLIDECIKDPKNTEICSSKEFREKYNAIHKPKSLSAGRQGRIYPMHNMDYYGQKGKILGSGTYGEVYKVGTKYAVKKFKNRDDDGVGYDTIKEIAILRRLDNPNTLRLIDILDFKLDVKNIAPPIEILLPLATGDLNVYIKTGQLNVDVNKSYIYQLTRGLLYLHDSNIVHRDLKPANILMMDGGSRLVIADYGLSRIGFMPGGTYSNEIQTAWWRAPEILLGSKNYSKSVDVFSLGIIFLELFIGASVFAFVNTEDILMKQISLLGNMTDDEWPGISGMRAYTDKIAKFAQTRRHGKFDLELSRDKHPKYIDIPSYIKNVILMMMTPNPSKRPTMREVLNILKREMPDITSKVDKTLPFVDNGPYVCGSNLDSSILFTRIKPIDVGGNSKDYSILFEWMLEVAEEYYLKKETFYHARQLFVYYVARKDTLDAETQDYTPVERKTYQTLGVACILISSKLYDVASVGVDDLVYISSGAATRNEILKAELSILKLCNFDLVYPVIPEYLAEALQDHKDKIDLANVFAQVSCFRPVYIEPRTTAYAAAYIALEGKDLDVLPKCFYDEIVDMEKIKKEAVDIVEFIRKHPQYEKIFRNVKQENKENFLKNKILPKY